jgi:DNA-binding NtrC family response regulator
VTQYHILQACTMSTSATCGHPNHKPRVFVVDDEQVIAHTLAVILRQAGYDAHHFYGAKPALEAAQFVPPDLLLTDVVTADLDGIELACRMTDHCPACKVLLFSGHATTTSLLNDERAAGRSFEVLRKPLHPNDLLAKVEFSSGGRAT